jgi:PAS domain S-box-containing protein
MIVFRLLWPGVASDAGATQPHLAFFSYLFLGATGVYIVLGILAIARNRKSVINWLCAATSFSLAFLAFADVFHTMLPLITLAQAHQIARIREIGGYLFPGFWVLFALVITDRRRLLRSWLTYALLAVFMIGFNVAVQAGLGDLGVKAGPLGWTNDWAPGFWSFTYLAYVLSTTILGLVLVVRFGAHAREPRQRRQARVIFYTGLASLILGVFNDIVVVAIVPTHTTVITGLATLIWASGMFISVTRYGLRRFTPEAAADGILATMLDPLLLVNPEGAVVTVNRATHDLLGYPPAELTNQSVRRIFAEPEKFDAAFGKVMTEGQVSGVELACRTRAGREIQTLLSARTMRSDGAVLGSVVALHDITRRKEAEHQLARLNAVLRAIRNVNQLIAREKDPDRILSGGCRHLLENSDYRCAWVALFDAAQAFVASAHAGCDGYPPVLERIRNGELPAEVRLALDAPRAVVWTEEEVESSKLRVERSGSSGSPPSTFNSSGFPLSTLPVSVRQWIAVRLEQGGRVFGVLCVAVAPGTPEVSEEQALLAELASDLAHAVHSLEIEAERKRTQDALEVSENRYRNVVEGVRDGVFTLDRQCRLSFVNTTVAQRAGVPAGAMIGRSMLDFCRGEDRPLLKRNIEIVLQGGRIPAFEIMELNPTGAAYPVELMISPVQEDGQVTGVLGVSRDLRERREAEVALKASEERFKQVVENAHEWIWEVDREGVYTYSSPVVEEILGYASEELVGQRHFFDLYHPEDREPSQEAATQAMASRLPFREFINRRLSKDGRVLWLSTSGVPVLDTAGNLVGYRGVDTDITERRRAEDEIRANAERLKFLNRTIDSERVKLLQATEQLTKANAELKRLSEAKSEFVASVSHDLRTPLTTIIEGIALTEDGTLGPVNDEQRQFLRLAHEDAERLNELIGNILDVQKIEQGKLHAKKVSVDVGATIAGIRTSFALHARELQLTLDVEIPAETLCVWCDSSHYHRVLTNLLSNAFKYTPGGGRISIRAGRNADGTITTSVHDNGAGIPLDQHSRIFGKFDQVERAEHELRPGTGLGLSLCKQLVELNGGTIGFESEPDRGSTLHFVLPAAKDKGQGTREER